MHLGDTIAKARIAQAKWNQLSFEEKNEKIYSFATYVHKNIDQIVNSIMVETGKPKFEVLGSDIIGVFGLIDFYTKNAKEILSPKRVKLSYFIHKKSIKIYKPLGVIGIISPWNFPFSIPVGEVLTALFGGNAVILKPSEILPQTGKLIESCFKNSDLPENLVQVIFGEAETGRELVNSSVDKIIFTGSVATGIKVAQNCVQNLKPVSLELGGKDAMIICEDADIDFAIDGAIFGGFVNSGQVCASVERIIIHEKIYDEFIKKIVPKLNSLKQSSQTDQGNKDLGKIIAPRQKEIYKEHLAEVKQKILTGGEFTENETALKPTLVLCDGTEKVWNEETFGPVIAIKKFTSIDEAIKIANNSKFGLLASIWTRNEVAAVEYAKRIEAGTVLINDCTFTHALGETPWFGVKESGYGHPVHGEEGLLAVVQLQHIHFDRFYRPLIKPLWWFPYSESQFEFFKIFLDFLYYKNLRKFTSLLKLMGRFVLHLIKA